uniref:Protein TsetseEP domain-containing protein n=1 Tax=Anopheles minimus TaxID=112268 RepID=A0A182W6M9_9DIPT
MRFWFVLLLGALLSGRCISSNDPYEELESCGVSLFSFIMTRLNQQIEEYTACQQLNGGESSYNCSGSIQRAKVDLQQELLVYEDCTKDIHSRTELIACSSTLFHLAAIRISRQFEEFVECKRNEPNVSYSKDCSDTIKRATDDLQQGLQDFNHCTKDIR